MTIKIIGAGMAGLLAARMLYRHDPVVYEQQPSLPNNHSAVLRFRTPEVGNILGIPFKKVRVLKGAAFWRGPVASVMAYTDKILGEYRSDRSMPTKFEVVDRWIAPPDLIARMAEGVNVVYGHDFTLVGEKTKVISTIPMSNLMEELAYLPKPKFDYTPGFNIKAKVGRCHAYLSLYVPDPTMDFYRVSITGDEMIIEFSGEFAKQGREVRDKVNIIKACAMIGVDPDRIIEHKTYEQRYAKINPIPEAARREFIYWASSLQGKAYSLGRFATWRPGLLMDDVPKDVRFIDSMMTGQVDAYAAESDHYRRER